MGSVIVQVGVGWLRALSSLGWAVCDHFPGMRDIWLQRILPSVHTGVFAKALFSNMLLHGGGELEGR